MLRKNFRCFAVAPLDDTDCQITQQNQYLPCKYLTCGHWLTLKDDPTTHCGRRNQLIKLIVFILIPCIGLFVQSAFTVVGSIQSIDDANNIEKIVNFSVDCSHLVHVLQIERGMSALYVSSNYSDQVFQQLIQIHATTDTNYSSLACFFDNNTEMFDHVVEVRNYLAFNRQKITNRSQSANEVVTFYTDTIAVIIKNIWQKIQQFKHDELWKSLVSFQLLMAAQEETGAERAIGSTYFAQTSLNPQSHARYIQKNTRGQTLLYTCFKYSTIAYNYYIINISQSTFAKTISKQRNQIIDNIPHQPSVVAGTYWFNNMTRYITSLYGINNRITNNIMARLEESKARANGNLTLVILLLGVICFVCPSLLFLLYRLMSNMQNLAKDLSQRTNQLNQERQRADNLLNQMMPPSVADRLKKNLSFPAQSFDDVTIYFSDIVGFTRICHSSTPIQVINMLNTIYSTFDKKIEQFIAYKMETVGDAYMVVSGLPTALVEKRHAAEIANFSLAIQRGFHDIRVPHMQNCFIQFRTGIHSGPCAAGIVGSKAPRYCLFGNTVNTASRLETNGEASKIHISKKTKENLDFIGGYITTSRGLVSMKGLGEMETFWLIGKA
uniref:guanylate cyclase n=1 Tax=Placozoa sp. H4 TaxID=1034858 RepID=A0A7G7LKC5_9METZ|nr:NIT domain GCY 3 [Placozoa sp. H4]